MRLVWNSFLSPPSSDRVKEPCQPLFLCFNQDSYGMAVTFISVLTEVIFKFRIAKPLFPMAFAELQKDRQWPGTQDKKQQIAEDLAKTRTQAHDALFLLRR